MNLKTRLQQGIKGFLNQNSESIDDMIIQGNLDTPLTSINSCKENPFVENIYDTIAKDIANFTFKEVAKSFTEPDATTNLESPLNKLLLERPNPLQTPYEFIEVFAKSVVKYGHGIAIPIYSDIEYEELEINEVPYYLESGGGELIGFKSIDVGNFVFGKSYTSDKNNIYLVYTDLTIGTTVTVPYDSIIHVRYKADTIFKGELFNTYDFNPLNTIFNTNLSLMIDRLSSSNKITGILKIKYVPGDEKTKVNRLKAFTDAFLGGWGKNPSGIAVMDPNDEFQALDKHFEAVSSEDIKGMTDLLYKFFGLNEDLLTCNYDEKQYNAYKKHTLMPIATKLAQELTYKLCKPGYKVAFYDFNFNGASLKDIALFVDKNVYHGVLTPNFILTELYGIEPYEGGDIRYSNANAVPLKKKEGR